MRNIPEPMSEIRQVHTTTDYSLFKSIDGNRTINTLHLNRLRLSIVDNYLLTVIIVNEKYEIIDGQHRYECIKELGYPLHYIICKGYGLNEVHRLNQNSKNWVCEDYLDGYCKLGYKDYIVFKEFRDKYKIGYNECMGLLSGTGFQGGYVQKFRRGLFKVTHLFEAEDFMDKIYMIEPYYANIRRRYFIYAMMQLLEKPQFEFTEFLQKVRIQPLTLQDCKDTNQYILLIEEIYNYKRHNKVSLRF